MSRFIHSDLTRGLGPWRIFSIAFTGTVGYGLFIGSGKTLLIAGPGGAIAAFLVVGAIAVCVMEGISQMIMWWPIPNGMVEFVGEFVDRDLGTVVGVAYWYTNAAGFATLNLAALLLTDGWFGLPIAARLGVFMILVPLLLCCINFCGVRFYGKVEVVGLVFKLLVVLIAPITMISINHGAGKVNAIGSEFIDMGFQNNPSMANNPFVAFCIAVPLTTFAYIGIEGVTIAAFEASDDGNSLRKPAKRIAYIIWFIYVICVCSFVANVKWNDAQLLKAFNAALQSRSEDSTNTGSTGSHHKTDSVFIIALTNANQETMATAMTVCLCLVVLSTANTTLYVASRAIYGLAKSISQPGRRSWLLQQFSLRLGSTTYRKNVPAYAVLCSALAFSWLPFLSLAKDSEDIRTIQTITIRIGVVGCVVVWASQCLAYIRCRSWIKRHRENPEMDASGPYHRYNLYLSNNTELHPHMSPYLAYFQPLLAWLGLVGCIIIIVLNSANIWNGEVTTKKWVSGYLGPILMAGLFVILKCFKRRSWVRQDGSFDDLRAAFTRLEDRINPITCLGDVELQNRNPNGANG